MYLAFPHPHTGDDAFDLAFGLSYSWRHPSFMQAISPTATQEFANRHRMLMKRTIFGFFPVVLIFLTVSPFAAAEVLETYPEGVLNWTRGWIEAHGTHTVDPAKVDASLDLATNEAKHNLYKVMLAVTIDAESSVRDFVLDDQLFPAKLHELVAQADIVEPVDFITDGTVKVHIRMSIYDGFSQLMLPQGIRQVEPIAAVTAVGKEGSGSPVEKTADKGRVSDAVSGLIVDASAVTLQPSLVIRVIDESGEEVYGPEFVSRENVVQQGMCGYHSCLDTVEGETRVAPHPMMVRGLRSSGANRCDIVISNADAARIRGVPELLPHLRKCRVIVVTGSR